jgi:hypothetical protein
MHLPLDRDTCRLVGAIAGLAACIGDVIVPLVLGWRVEGYSHLRQVQSELGAAGSPVAWWVNAWWIAFGVLMVLLAAGVECTWGARGLWAHVLAGQVLVVGVILGIGAGLFPMDLPGAERTLAGRLHETFGGLGFLAMLMIPVVVWVAFPEAERLALRVLAVVAGVAGLVSLVLFVRAPLASAASPLRLSGLWQRTLLGSYYVLLCWLAVEMLRGRRG